MPEEIAVIIVISILGGFFMSFVKMILNYRKERLRIQSAPGEVMEEGLSESELKALMYAAVAKAVGPLEDKIDDLEAQVEALVSSPALLDAAPLIDDGVEDAPEPTRVRRRRATRS